jgi:hypothetical protein
MVHGGCAVRGGSRQAEVILVILSPKFLLSGEDSGLDRVLALESVFLGLSGTGVSVSDSDGLTSAWVSASLASILGSTWDWVSTVELWLLRAFVLEREELIVGGWREKGSSFLLCVDVDSVWGRRNFRFLFWVFVVQGFSWFRALPFLFSFFLK